jgi:DNA-binding MarR family transcriptional regulator
VPEDSVSNVLTVAGLGQPFAHARRGELRELRIDFTLDALDSDGALSQRELARQLNVALGSANALLKLCVHRGWVRVVPGTGHRCRYVLTAPGARERLRRHRSFIAATAPVYTSVRRRMTSHFERFSSLWPRTGDEEPVEKRIVLYGSADVVELAHLCVARTDLRLVAAVSDEREAELPGIPTYLASADWLRAIGEGSFDRLVVLPSIADPKGVQQRVRASGVAMDRIDWF